MDPITHGIAGALLGKGLFSEKQRRVAIFAATLGAVFPDVDIVAELVSRDPLAIVKYHRGITHSFVALPVFAMLLAWLTRSVTRRRNIEAPSWGMLSVIYGVGIASHILLDGTTSFGTRMWMPFSERRVAWDLMFIIDFVLTSLLLLPQVISWIYNQDARNQSASFTRAAKMWLLFTAAGFLVWTFALLTGYPFHLWITLLVSAILAGLFFLPGVGGWGLGVKRSTWCRAGICAVLGYVFFCGLAHHAAMTRVENFAAEHHIVVDRIGALPVPPSLLDWGDAIRATEGVYEARFDLRQAQNPSFYFVADSPLNAFTAKAFELPEVQLYWHFARFPTVHSSLDLHYAVVDFSEHRFNNGNRRSPQPFSYRVIFDSEKEVVAEGWLQNGMFMQLMRRMEPARVKTNP